VLDLLERRDRAEPARYRKVMDEMVRFAIRNGRSCPWQ